MSSHVVLDRPLSPLSNHTFGTYPTPVRTFEEPQKRESLGITTGILDHMSILSQLSHFVPINTSYGAIEEAKELCEGVSILFVLPRKTHDLLESSKRSS